MISIVTYGRNDNYSYNLVKRIAFSFNCLAEVLTEEDEILFTDYNTPDHLPTLPESIWDTLTDKALSLVKVIRIPSHVHELIKRDSPLPILENVSRNAAIVRSNPKNRWILSTNPDVLLVLSSRWRNLTELLHEATDSFYEMPRMDIPESVWSSLDRKDPKTNIRALRDWLISNGAAVAETSPDWQFQKYILFDGPGDFQLAPREYFFRLRGFDEAMNKYFHSDSNLAKRMWLLNGSRTDHLLGSLWVLHQDHYLSGEWARTVTRIVHNDLSANVALQNTIEANGASWGLSDVCLPTFSLCEKITKERVNFCRLPESEAGGLPLSQEIDWRTHPIHRLSNYRPEVLALYLRESLRVVSPDALLVYLGQNAATAKLIHRLWNDISPSGPPMSDLAIAGEKNESLSPDVLLVDCYYDRSEYAQKRIRLVQEQMQRRVEKGRMTERELVEEVSNFANNIDVEAWQNGLFPVWERSLPRVQLIAGALVIVLGCNNYAGPYVRLKEMLTTLRLKSPNHIRRGGDDSNRNVNLELVPLYIHHRLMVLRVTSKADVSETSEGWLKTRLRAAFGGGRRVSRA